MVWRFEQIPFLRKRWGFIFPIEKGSLKSEDVRPGPDQLNPTEVNHLRSHFATSVKGLCHAKAPRPPRINNFGKRISAGCYGVMPKVIFALFAPWREIRLAPDGINL
jgi:hypothetical protein